LPDQSRLRADLHDVLIYAPGQFFQSHQDSEKCDGMVATLVVVLPSPHKGGGLIIDHQGVSRVNYFVRFRDNYDGRLSIFGLLRFFLVFSPVTVAIDFKDRGMVDNSVDGCHGHQGVREYLIPVAKWLV